MPRVLLMLLALLAALLSAAILLGALPALGLPLATSLTPLWWGLLLTLLLVAGCDALWLHRLPSPRLQRSLPGNLPLGRWSEVRLTLHHDYRQPLAVQAFADHQHSSAQRDLADLVVTQGACPGIQPSAG